MSKLITVTIPQRGYIPGLNVQGPLTDAEIDTDIVTELVKSGVHVYVDGVPVVTTDIVSADNHAEDACHKVPEAVVAPVPKPPVVVAPQTPVTVVDDAPHHNDTVIGDNTEVVVGPTGAVTPVSDEPTDAPEVVAAASPAVSDVNSASNPIPGVNYDAVISGYASMSRNAKKRAREVYNTKLLAQKKEEEV